MVTVILGVFLMGYVVGEGKSNYFKGSSLILTYLVFVVGFYFSGFNNLDVSAYLYVKPTFAHTLTVNRRWALTQTTRLRSLVRSKHSPQSVARRVGGLTD
jgi:hypothetical protein